MKPITLMIDRELLETFRREARARFVGRRWLAPAMEEALADWLRKVKAS